MNTSKKNNKKEKEKQNLNFEVLYMNNNNHESLNEIEKEKNIILNIENFSNYLMDILNEITSSTTEYCTKINQIIEKLNDNTNDIINNFPKKKLVNNIYKILKEIIETIIKNFVDLELEKSNDEDIFTNIEKNLKNSEQILLLDIQKMEFTKEAYHQEFSNFELSLIKEELNPKENGNINNENIITILELQKSYFDVNKKLKGTLKRIFEMFNLKRKYLLKLIQVNFKKYLGNIKNAGEKINKQIDEISSNLSGFNTDNYLKQNEERINNIFKEDIYEFKFLSLFKTLKEGTEDTKLKNNDHLLNDLGERNIENLVEKIEKFDIYHSEEDIKKFELIKTNKIIKSIAKLIIETPEKYEPEEKENLMSLIKNSIQNQYLFLLYLNNYRTKHKLNLNEQTIKIFCEIFLYILNMGYENENYNLIQLCIIISQTFYHEKSDNSKEKKENKIYLITYLKNNKIFKEKIFWKNFLEGLVDDKLMNLNKNKNQNKTISEKQQSKVIISCIYTVTKNMVDFNLEMDFIITLVHEIFDKYDIPDIEKKDIINYLIVELQKITK